MHSINSIDVRNDVAKREGLKYNPKTGNYEDNGNGVNLSMSSYKPEELAKDNEIRKSIPKDKHAEWDELLDGLGTLKDTHGRKNPAGIKMAVERANKFLSKNKVPYKVHDVVAQSPTTGQVVWHTSK